MTPLDRRQQRFREKYGRWAVVTGASSGIGRACAEQLAAGGFDLVLVARSAEALKIQAESYRSRFGMECRVVAVDLAVSAGVQEVLRTTTALDVGLLVAAAGFGTSGALLTSELETELQMVDVNCRAVLALTGQFVRRFAERGRGGIIMFSSIVAFQGNPYAANYAATKAYVLALAEGLSREVAGRGIDVLASCPGPTATGFAQRARMTMGKAMSPEDVARSTLNALGRRSAVLPGFLSKLLTYSLMPLPRFLRVRIMGKIMKGMSGS